MFVEVLTRLPGWLIQGVLAGVVGSLLVAGLFYVVVRRFPGHGATEPSASGTSRRRQEIRSYLDTIDEQYAERHFVEGQHVAFYLPQRDVAITFDARAFYRIQPSGTEAVLVEHELPGVALGARLPFETPEIDLDLEEDTETDLDPQEAAFAVLGLPAGAGVEDVREAYRRKVKEVHPDHGGDEEQFKQVREAYTTAKKHAG